MFFARAIPDRSKFLVSSPVVPVVCALLAACPVVGHQGARVSDGWTREIFFLIINVLRGLPTGNAERMTLPGNTDARPVDPFLS